jgi:hypothetical protein
LTSPVCAFRARADNNPKKRTYQTAAGRFRQVARANLHGIVSTNPASATRPPAMAQAASSLAPRRFGETSRPDAWWVQPLVIFAAALGVCDLFHLGGVSGKALHVRAVPVAVLFARVVWQFASRVVWTEARLVAAWLIFSPALLILWIPAGFRLTCYYYRGAYYKSFWADPPSCAVGEPRSIIAAKTLSP